MNSRINLLLTWAQSTFICPTDIEREREREREREKRERESQSVFLTMVFMSIFKCARDARNICKKTFF